MYESTPSPDKETNCDLCKKRFTVVLKRQGIELYWESIDALCTQKHSVLKMHPADNLQYARYDTRPACSIHSCACSLALFSILDEATLCTKWDVHSFLQFNFKFNSHQFQCIPTKRHVFTGDKQTSDFSILWPMLTLLDFS